MKSRRWDNQSEDMWQPQFIFPWENFVLHCCTSLSKYSLTFILKKSVISVTLWQQKFRYIRVQRVTWIKIKPTLSRYPAYLMADFLINACTWHWPGGRPVHRAHTNTPTHELTHPHEHAHRHIHIQENTKLILASPSRDTPAICFLITGWYTTVCSLTMKSIVPA